MSARARGTVIAAAALVVAVLPLVVDSGYVLGTLDAEPAQAQVQDLGKDLMNKASEQGGIAPVIRGPGGLGEAALPARAVQERLKAAFDPNGVLAPGRFWGGI